MFSVPERRAASPPRSPLPHPAAFAASSASGGCDLQLFFGWVALMREGLGVFPLLPWAHPVL